ncbi:hypothetical protein K8I61_15595 [bacterium]|nr:hypothetical protein [bacterium]
MIERRHPIVRRLRIAAAAVVAGVALVVAADLLLRLSSPVSRVIDHAIVFAINAAGTAMLGEADLVPVSVAALFALIVYRLRTRAPRVWAVTHFLVSAVAAMSIAIFVAFGFLMDRALAAASIAALVVFFLSSRPPGNLTAGERSGVRRRASALAFVVSIVSLAYGYRIHISDPEGYAIPRFAQALGSTRLWTFGLFGAMTAAAMASLVAARFGRRYAGRARAIAAAEVAGLATLAAFGALLRPTAPIVAACVAIVPLIADAMRAHSLPVLPRITWDARRWPAGLAALALAGTIGLAHGYATRVWVCPRDAPYLERIAKTPLLFRMAMAPSGMYLLAVAREEGRLLRVRTSAPFEVDDVSLSLYEDWAVRAWAEHVGGAPDPTLRVGVMEDLIAMPEEDRFLATYMPATPLWPLFPEPGEYRNIIMEIDGAAGRLASYRAWPDMCWLNRVHYDSARGLVIATCENKARLFTAPRDLSTFETHELPWRVGDIHDMAIARTGAGSRYYTSSLWISPLLSVLDEAFAPLPEAALVDGMSYAIERDPLSGDLFTSHFYAARALRVDDETMKVTHSYRAGFGARNLAIDETRRRLFVTSNYGGFISVVDLDTNRRAGVVDSGGYVKAFVIDRERKYAWFGCFCGLYRLDLDKLDAALGAAR